MNSPSLTKKLEILYIFINKICFYIFLHKSFCKLIFKEKFKINLSSNFSKTLKKRKMFKIISYTVDNNANIW